MYSKNLWTKGAKVTKSRCTTNRTPTRRELGYGYGERTVQSIIPDFKISQDVNRPNELQNSDGFTIYTWEQNQDPLKGDLTPGVRMSTHKSNIDQQLLDRARIYLILHVC